MGNVKNTKLTQGYIGKLKLILDTKNGTQD